jgi:murein L,D-transpeptidase YcbB/YkuD
MPQPDDHCSPSNSRLLFQSFLIFISAYLLTCTTQCSAPHIKKTAFADTTVYSKIDFTSIHLDSTLLKSYLNAEGIDPEVYQNVHQFYTRRQFQPAWFNESGFSDAAYNFSNLIHDFQSHIGDPGVSPSDLVQMIDSFKTLEKLNRLDPELVLNLEMELTLSFFRFAQRAYQGIGKNPRDLEWYIPRKKKDFKLMLDAIISGHKELTSFEPVNSIYQKLKSQLIKIQSNANKIDSLASALSFSQCTDSLMDQDSSLWLNFLTTTGDATTSGRKNPDWKIQVREGLRSYQARHGLVRSGKPDHPTLSFILTPVEQYLHKILINMERLRWMPESGFRDMIVVNIPEFRLKLYADSSQIWSCKVVVGDAAHRTQIFSGDINEIVFNPYWMVPSSIAIQEMLPKLKADARYLEKNNLELLSGTHIISPKGINWSRYTDHIPYQIRQKPGPDNSLGLVKFLFPNSFSIYLHDTPAKELFSENRRDFSHGCIRVSEPLKLAEYILKRDGNPLSSKVKNMVNKDTERRIKIRKTMPVIIYYLTAWVDSKGNLQIRKDIYGLDRTLAKEIMTSPSTLTN